MAAGLIASNTVVENKPGGVINNKDYTVFNTGSQFINDAGAAVTMNNALKYDVWFESGSTGVNYGSFNIPLTIPTNDTGIALNGTSSFINSGLLSLTGGSSSVIASKGNAATNTTSNFWNRADGVVNFAAGATGKAAVNFSASSSNFAAINDGVINLTGNGAVGIYAGANVQAVNNGTINVGAVGNPLNQSNMVAMQLASGALASAVIENDGIINIYAKNSYAFSKLGANGHVVNTGTINIDPAATGSGIVQQAGITPETTKVATYTLPPVPTPPAPAALAATSAIRAAQVTVLPTASAAPATNVVSQYVIGTTANQTAGKMLVSNANLAGVSVDTGFTAGTSQKSVTFNGVFQGNNIQGAQNIRSNSAVWKATGTATPTGVNVTMTKIPYQNIVTNPRLTLAATALESAYSTNVVFQSLNLPTAGDVTNGIGQLTGGGFASAMDQTRVLSNRFSALADDTVIDPQTGLGINVMTKGSQGSQLNGAQYDMAVLSKVFKLSGDSQLTVRYGAAQLDAGVTSTDNGGLTGSSQFAGAQYRQPLGDVFELDTSAGVEQHRLQSHRLLAYGSVNQSATANNTQDRINANGLVGVPVKLANGGSMTPALGLVMRHTRDGAVQEYGAADYDLNVSPTSATALDAVASVRLDYVDAASGLGTHLNLQGGPNVYYQGGQRTARLDGAPTAAFDLLGDETSHSRFNYGATAGLAYRGQDHALALDAYASSLDSTRDYGVMLNYAGRY